MQNLLLKVKIQGKRKLYFEGAALAVTSYNVNGVFDILPYHANFISIIQTKIVVTKEDNTKVDFPIQKGVLRVMQNVVEVFLDF